MKKTLLVTMDFYPSVGGIAQYWMGLSDEMPPSNWVILAPELPSGVRERPGAYIVYRKPFLSRFWFPKWLKLVFTIIDIAKKENIRCIIAGQILPVGSAVRIASFCTGIPYCISLHGMDLGMAGRSRRKKALAASLLRHAQVILVNSTYTFQQVQTYGIEQKRISLLYPCSVTFEEKNDTPKTSDHFPILLTVARLVKRKGHEYVIRALPKLIESFPTCIYSIVGGGHMRRDLMKLVRELSLEQHVDFVGIVSDEMRKKYYRECDIFVMAPYEELGDVEGFGMAYIEANSFGKAVIGSRSGGISDAIIDGETGLLVSEKNSSEIADAVLLLTRDPELCNRLGKQGRERVQREFRWEIQAQKLKNILTYV
ncbi:MAG: glycosyltransferase family 4 protein [Patescibacteria group bacterium]